MSNELGEGARLKDASLL